MKLDLCPKCASAIESAYTVKRQTLATKRAKCAHCGKRVGTSEYIIDKK